MAPLSRLGAAWAATSFSVLAGIAIIGKVLERFGPLLPPTWVVKVILAALLIIPFCFYRFAAAFSRPRPWVRAAALLLTVGVIGWTAALPYFPLPMQPEPSWFLPYRIAIGVQWGFLFTFVAVRLWRAGTRQPAAARARMRLLAAAAAGLDIQIVLGVLGLSRRPAVALATQALTVVMAVLFGLGLTLPMSIRSWSRRHERSAVQDAVAELVGATSTDEVAQNLLPHVAAFVGASRVAWIGSDGEEVAHFGGEPPAGSVELRLGEGAHLVAWTSPYIPFFAKDEIGTLKGIGHLLESWANASQ